MLKKHRRIRSISIAIITLIFIAFCYPVFNKIRQKSTDHFKVQNVVVFPESLQTRVQKQLEGRNLVAISFSDIKQMVREVTPYDTIKIQKILPDTLNIAIDIHLPAVFSTIDGKRRYFDEFGDEAYLTEWSHVANQDDLVEISGIGAVESFSYLLSILKNQCIQCNKMEFIDQRRWNIHLNNGILVKLPKYNFNSALLLLPKFLKADSIINEVKEIDLRLYPGKIYLTKS